MLGKPVMVHRIYFSKNRYKQALLYQEANDGCLFSNKAITNPQTNEIDESYHVVVVVLDTINVVGKSGMRLKIDSA